jgi:branched-chain amino acid transport system permease protein
VIEILALLGSALISGILIGGFYACAALGVSITFGMLSIVNIAHPGFMLLGAFLCYFLNVRFGIDPLVAGSLLMPVFFILGSALYLFYERVFERRRSENIRGLAFFFGLLFIIEVGIILTFGVDYRSVDASYIGQNLHIFGLELPLRLLIPFLAALFVLALFYLFLSRTFIGRAILAVAQDSGALELMAADPIKIKRIAFGLSIASAAAAGALLIIIQTVEPSMARDFIGRLFAICVLGGLGSLPGMVIAALTIGVAESITSTFIGPSWAPAVSFSLLLATLLFRPSGLMGRA